MLSMTPISRRKFMEKAVISSGAAGFLAASASNLSAAPLGLPIGSQVWPTRSMIKDFPAYVKMMADIGVTRLELCSPVGYGAEFSSLANGKEVARILADHGMKSESSHFTMEELRKTQQKSIDWAKEVGITQIITATLGGGNNPTLDPSTRSKKRPTNTIRSRPSQPPPAFSKAFTTRASNCRWWTASAPTISYWTCSIRNWSNTNSKCQRSPLASSPRNTSRGTQAVSI